MDATAAYASSHDQESAILPDLWRRRSCLSHDEMLSIYNLVRSALRAYHPLELQSLREDKDELVAQFIYAKVLRLEPGHGESKANADSAPSSSYAVCAYFRRYLIDCLRSASHQRDVSLDVDGIVQEVDEHVHALDHPVHSVLMEYGLDEATVRHLARRFIAELDDHEQIVLAGSIGWCSERKGGLSGVAARYRIPSYHYRAAKLGVARKKASHPEDFAATKIGRWLNESLGIAITEENRVVMLVALNLLAAESGESRAESSNATRGD